MIHYTSPAPDYARRPRAPRRRHHTPARPLDEPGQLSLDRLERAQLVDLAVRLYLCRMCRAATGEQCTRPPSLGETGRQPLRWMCHAERYELVTADDVAELARADASRAQHG